MNNFLKIKQAQDPRYLTYLVRLVKASNCSAQVTVSPIKKAGAHISAKELGLVEERRLGQV